VGLGWGLGDRGGLGILLEDLRVRKSKRYHWLTSHLFRSVGRSSYFRECLEVLDSRLGCVRDFNRKE
jgi:hypothetical protein